MRQLERLRGLAKARSDADEAWRAEIMRQSDVYSVRAIAEAAGVSHTQVWRILKGSR